MVAWAIQLHRCIQMTNAVNSGGHHVPGSCTSLSRCPWRHVPFLHYPTSRFLHDRPAYHHVMHSSIAIPARPQPLHHRHSCAPRKSSFGLYLTSPLRGPHKSEIDHPMNPWSSTSNLPSSRTHLRSVFYPLPPARPSKLSLLPATRSRSSRMLV